MAKVKLPLSKGPTTVQNACTYTDFYALVRSFTDFWKGY